MHNVLIFGFGYTAQFIAKTNLNVIGTTRNKTQNPALIAFKPGAIATALTNPKHIIISIAPELEHDPVLTAFTDILHKYSKHILSIVYLSSTGVYGNHFGNWVDENSATNAGQARLVAEQQWQNFAQNNHLPLTILRLAGIYGPQRNIISRIKAGKHDTTVKHGHFFSRIHVEDIAQVVFAVINEVKPGIRIYNVADDEPAPSYVVDNYAAQLLHTSLQQVPYEQALLTPMAQEFYRQNKRINNQKMKTELKINLLYPSYREGLRSLLTCPS